VEQQADHMDEEDFVSASNNAKCYEPEDNQCPKIASLLKDFVLPHLDEARNESVPVQPERVTRVLRHDQT